MVSAPYVDLTDRDSVVEEINCREGLQEIISCVTEFSTARHARPGTAVPNDTKEILLGKICLDRHSWMKSGEGRCLYS